MRPVEQGLQGLAAYGPVAMLAGMLLLLIRDLVLNRRQGPDPGVADALSQLAQRLEADRELARAIDRLALVLERMEATHGKALDEIQGLLHDQARTLQGIDYRTKEIRDRLTALEGRGERGGN